MSMTMTGSSVPVDNALNLPGERLSSTSSTREVGKTTCYDPRWAAPITMHIAGEKLRQLAPNTGVYINEVRCSSRLSSGSICDLSEIDLIPISCTGRHQRTRLAFIILRAKLPATLPDQTEVRPRPAPMEPMLPPDVKLGPSRTAVDFVSPRSSGYILDSATHFLGARHVPPCLPNCQCEG